MENICPRTSKCPLFNGKLLRNPTAENAYRNLYCHDKNNYINCKRWIVFQEMGICPDFVMPNSALTLEVIRERVANGDE